LAFVVPTLPAFSFSSWGTGGVSRNLTPIQTGSTSRIGGDPGAWPPAGVEATLTAWGFVAGAAPPGSKSLAVAASGLAMEAGNCWTFGGYARAYADIHVIVEEFEPLEEPITTHPGFGDLHDPSDTPELVDPGAVLIHQRFVRAVESGPTILINQETTALGYQIVDSFQVPQFTVLVMPITPGNAYRCWIASRQNAICQAVSGAGLAVSNIAFDFGPVFFAFT
jgi:hypothetical protein